MGNLISPALIAAFACWSPLSAQATWIVDAANGPGTNFTSLSAAIAAAGSGDTILVRSGDYPVGGQIIDEGLSILGIENDVDLIGGSSLSASLTVTNLPANASFVLRNVRLGGSLFGPDLSVQNCAGAVLIERIEGTLGPLLIPEGPRISMANCEQVHVHDAFVRGGGLINLNNVRGTLTSSVIEGELYSGLTCVNCELTIDDCTIDKDPIPLQVGAPIWISGGTVRIARTTVTASSASQNPMSAIATSNQSELWIDPTTTLVPMTGQPPIGGNANVTYDEIATLAPAAAPLTPTVVLLGSVASVHATLVSLPSATTWTPFGRLWLDPGNYLLLELGVFQTRTHSLQLPTLPLPTGLTFALQSLVLAPDLRFTNGVFYVTP